MSCSGAQAEIQEVQDFKALEIKYNEIKAKIDAIDERKAMALVNGSAGQDESSERAELVANAEVIEQVAQKKKVRVNKWYFDCSIKIAKKRAKAEEQKRAEREAERKRQDPQVTKLQDEAKLQKEMAAMMKQQLDAEANSRNQHASATPDGDIHKYAALIKATVERYMILDPTMRGKTCTIGVKLDSSGFVVSVSDGEGDPAVCRAGKEAVLKANQLPVPKDPTAFEMLKDFNLKLDPNI